MLALLMPPLLRLFALFAPYYIYKPIMLHPADDAAVTAIGDQIHRGAMVSMKREFRTLGVFGIVVLVCLCLFLGLKTAIAYLVGALASVLRRWLHWQLLPLSWNPSRPGCRTSCCG